MITKLYEFVNRNSKGSSKEPNTDFLKWFGESVVVKNGKPIVCYHGSNSKDITVFDYRKSIGDYGQGNYFTPEKREAQTYGKYLYRCYLRLVNPYEVEDRYEMNQVWDGFLYLKEQGKIGENDTIRDYLKSKGCDGIVVKNPIEDSKTPYYIVFDNNQIKSVDNDGTWDLADDNIYS